MKDGRSHSTLREWRDHMTQPLAAVIFCGLAVILTLIAPFGTDQAAGPLLRFVYWMLIAVLTYAIGSLAHAQAELRYKRRPLLRIAVSALMTAIGANLVVIGVNLAILSYIPTGRDLVMSVANISVIAIIITIIFQLLHDRPDTQGQSRPCILMDRLPLEKRGPLVALSVEDHYVRVRTRKGEEVLLMRLSDAIRETGDLAGVQVHRSHWIALDQVRSASRKGDSAVLRMSVGPDIPVSRSNVPAIKEAGLLPR
ncbi:MAG: LytTR family transcriptional regulator [Loktanella sp.]|nr:LytTR family transcriptional regulator [Loktanella sp.]